METFIPDVNPATKAAVTESVTPVKHVSLETPQGETTESEANITTSASAGKNCGALNLAHVFFYICC